MRFTAHLNIVTATVVTVLTVGTLSATGAQRGHQQHNPISESLPVGAIIPPTTGRFVVEFGRWFFVADYPEFAGMMVPNSIRRQTPPVNRFRSASTSSAAIDEADLNRACGRPESTKASGAQRTPANPLRENEPHSRFAFDTHASDAYSHALPDSILVADNLMRDRLARQVNEHPSRDSWVVSGEVIRQFGRPCLLIHAAHRPAGAFPLSAK